MAACEARDPKGLYAKAHSGEIPDFTGVTAPYETPEKPELNIDTGVIGVDDSMQRLQEYVTDAFALP